MNKKRTIFLMLVLITTFITISAIFYKLRLTDLINLPLNGILGRELLATHYKGVECTKLIGRTVKPNNDVAELEKDVCISERAWFENNPALCNSHLHKDRCFGWMAIKTGDLSLCQLTTKRTGYFWVENQLKDSEKQHAWLYDCYRKVANWRNDPSICDSIPYISPDLLQSCKESSIGWGQKFSDYDKFSPI